MASLTDKKRFADSIAIHIIQNCLKYGYDYPSAIVCQACHESSYGESSLSINFNYWGITAGKTWKGAVVEKRTWEDRNRNGKKDSGEETVRRFRAYDDIASGIDDYFQIIRNVKNYKALPTATSADDYIEKIAKGGWATDAKYAQKLISLLHSSSIDFDKYDLALQTCKGKFGNGAARKTALGPKWRAVQDIVNAVYK